MRDSVSEHKVESNRGRHSMFSLGCTCTHMCIQHTHTHNSAYSQYKKLSVSCFVCVNFAVFHKHCVLMPPLHSSRWTVPISHMLSSHMWPMWLMWLPSNTASASCPLIGLCLNLKPHSILFVPLHPLLGLGENFVSLLHASMILVMEGTRKCAEENVSLVLKL